VHAKKNRNIKFITQSNKNDARGSKQEIVKYYNIRYFKQQIRKFRQFSILAPVKKIDCKK
jgi:hypothetical protein